MDPWYGLGGADMLDVAHMAVHGAPMTSREAVRWTFDAVTEIPARILGLEDYGLAVGNNADMVLLQAADPIEAVRMRATRLLVIRRDQVRAVCPVDEVHGIHRFHPRELKEVPATVARATSTYSKALLSWRDRSVGLLDDELLFHSVKRSVA